MNILKILIDLFRASLPKRGIAVDLTTLSGADFKLENDRPFTVHTRAEGEFLVGYEGKNESVASYGLAGQYHPQEVTAIRTASTVKVFTIFPV